MVTRHPHHKWRLDAQGAQELQLQSHPKVLEHWPTQPAIQLQVPCSKPPLSTCHTRAKWLSGGKHK